MDTRWYKMHASSDAEGLYLVEDNLPKEDYLFERDLRGLLELSGAIKDDWPSFDVYSAYANPKHLQLDFAAPLFVWRSAVSKHAMECLRSRLESYVEWLPLSLQDGREFFVPHPLTMVDALDTDKSAITYVDGYPKEPKYITSVHHEWIHEVEALDGVPIFRTPETAGREVFVSSDLVNFIQSQGITGAAFAPVQLTEFPEEQA